MWWRVGAGTRPTILIIQMPIHVIKDDKYFGEMTTSVSRNPGTYR
jgi:hypothetical protein